MCSQQDGKFAVPRATRVGLTGEQLDRYCDGCLARAVVRPQLTEAEHIVYRSTQPQWETELDHRTVKVGVLDLCGGGLCLPAAGAASRACHVTCAACSTHLPHGLYCATRMPDGL